ncbi:MAG TPA: hypothetical protein VIT20_05185 [Propionibacteriaceae bacterium]
MSRLSARTDPGLDGLGDGVAVGVGVGVGLGVGEGEPAGVEVDVRTDGVVLTGPETVLWGWSGRTTAPVNAPSAAAIPTTTTAVRRLTAAAR